MTTTMFPSQEGTARRTEAPAPARPAPSRSATSSSALAGTESGVREAGTAEMVRAAAAGDEEAWTGLMHQFGGRVRATARSYGLASADVADVSQVVWLRLFSRLGQLRDPERVGAWLATTTRNECLLVLRRRGTVTPTSDSEFFASSTDPDPLTDLAIREQHEILRRFIRTLPDHQQHLMDMLLLDPVPSYKAISSALGIPVGSIGPTRQRCLSSLRAKYREAYVDPVRLSNG